MKKLTLAALAAIAVLAVAAPVAAQSARQGVTITSATLLPATCEPTGGFYVVIDATSASDCSTAGGGSVIHACYCNATGNGFVAQPGGAPDPDSVGTTELNDGSDTPLVSQLVAVDSALDSQFEYLGIGFGLTNDGDTFKFDWSSTLAADVALNVDECIPVATATGGGWLCEGSVADTNEMFFLVPDLNEVDTTHVFVTESATQTLLNKTLTQPTIADFTNAGHDHSGAPGGGDVALGAGSTGTTATQGDSDTSLATTAFVQGEIRGEAEFDAFKMFTDGTRCKAPVQKRINGGPFVGTVDCDKHASSEIGGAVLIGAYAGGAIVFTLEAVNVNATPSGVLDFDFSAMCRGDSDLIDATWSAASNAAITFTTQFDVEHALTAAVTPNGTCQAGDTLYWRALMDDVATTTQVADVELTRVTIREQ